MAFSSSRMKPHMVVGMPWSVHRSDSCALNPKYLTIINGLLDTTGRVLIDCFGKIGVEAQKIGDPSGVVTMPM
jgi:hypothetical protein